MKPSIVHFLMISLGQFLSLQGSVRPQYVLMLPQRTSLLPSLMFIRAASRVYPPTLSKQISAPLGQCFLMVASNEPSSSLLQLIQLLAPIDQTYLHFQSDPAIPTTQQPKLLASWTTIYPQAPAAAETNTVSPFLGFPILTNPIQAVRPEIPKTPRNFYGLGVFSGNLLTYFSFTIAQSVHPHYPITQSPAFSFPFEWITLPATPPNILSPGRIGSLQLLNPLIQTLFAASMEMNRVCTRACPWGT